MSQLTDVKRWLKWRFTVDCDGAPVASVLDDASKTDWPDPQRVFATADGKPPPGGPGIAPLWHESNGDTAKARAKSHSAAVTKMADSLSKPCGTPGAIAPGALGKLGYATTPVETLFDPPFMF